MNESVQQFIDRKKREVAEERKKLLAKIPELQVREYSDLKVCNEEYPIWDAVKGQPYKITAIDVSDDEFEAMNRYLQQEKEIKSEAGGLIKPSDAADRTISVLALISFVLALIGLSVGLLGLCDAASNRWDPTVLSVVIVGISAFVVFFLQWAMLRLFVNISVRLRQINNNINKTL